MKLLKKLGKNYTSRINRFLPGGIIEVPENWKTPEQKLNDYYLQQQGQQYADFQQSLDDQAKRQNEYINAYKNWEYVPIEEDYPIATNVWTDNGRIPIYRIPGSVMLKAFPNYTWNNGQTFDPNINYYAIRNAKGQYALVPQGSYISELMDQSFERDKTLHPTNIAASDMTTQVANVPTQYGIKPMPPEQPEEQETTQQAEFRQDNRSDWERQWAQNMYNFNNWYTDYQKQQQLENTIRDEMLRPVTLTNYIRATGDAINGDDNWFGSFFDPNKHGMWFGPRGRAFQQNHPFASGLLDLGVDMFGAKTIKPISNFASNVRDFRPLSITRNPNYYYRQGVGLIEDARQSGVIRAGVNPLTGRQDFQFPFFQKGRLHYGDSKWAPDIILNKGKGDFEWQPVNSVGFVEPGQLDYNMRTPLVNGQTNMADASQFSILKPVRIGKRTIGYIEKPLIKNDNTFGTVNELYNNAPKNQPLFSLSEEDIPSQYKTDNRVDLIKLYDYYFTKKPKKDALLKFARNEELNSLEGAVIADYNVQKSTVKGLEELFEDTIFKRTPKEYFADKKIDFNTFQKELKEGNYVSVDQRFINDTIGEGFKGYFSPDDNLIVISNGVDVWRVAPHEFRHMLDKIKKLPLEQVKMLEEAFTEDFRTLPEWVPETDTLHGYAQMESEMVTTNYDTWLKLMPKHLHKKSLELQNKFIDKVSDAKIVEALEKSNGYGRRYVERMRKQYGRVPPEVIKALRRSLKYVGMSTAVLYGTNNRK